MEGDDFKLLAGSEIHGFRTASDLNISKLFEDASVRWFRPNEVHAILSNYTLFKILPQPIDNPPSGSVLLFDRKMLRNFRKDGHNWKKKKDGKTVQEAHEKLKIGNEERIHVYYARSEDDPNFYRRCYWLLDKNLERFVIVHYRQTSEDNQLLPPPAPVESPNFSSKNAPFLVSSSISVSANSDSTGSAVISEEINSGDNDRTFTSLLVDDAELRNHEFIHEINTLDWADLVVESPAVIESSTCNPLPNGEKLQNGMRCSMNHDIYSNSEGEAAFLSSEHPINNLSTMDLGGMNQTSGGFPQTTIGQDCQSFFTRVADTSSLTTEYKSDADIDSRGTNAISESVIISHNSSGKCIDIGNDSFSLLEVQLQDAISNHQKINTPVHICQSSHKHHIFNINDISPGWAYATDETKILVVGCFLDSSKKILASSIYCVTGEACVAAEVIQDGVFRCTVLPQPPGVVNLFLTLDGLTPISQVLSFEYRSSPAEELESGVNLPEYDIDIPMWEEHEIQTRLAFLLFNSSDNISVLSGKTPPKYLKEAKRFQQLSSPLLEKDWMSFKKLESNNESSSLLELVLKNKLQEWLLEKIADGCKKTQCDSLGQGVIHLCAMLDYTWAVHLFSLSGMSLDFRDTRGWTALHWAAHYGREKMVAALLSAGANPSLVTDPTPEFPGGCIAADLASKQGHEGLAAYLAEKGLTAHFKAMSLSGNAGVQRTNSAKSIPDQSFAEHLSEQELCLKESLAAYRNAADAADRIQAAFRERTLKLQTKAVELAKPEPEAAHIVAAMKIQDAFRNYNRRKLMKAAARIQSKFRTWKIRRDFLNMRKQAVKIQAVFRGHQVRRQYKKIVWSVGVLEKAILRWRLKRKGLRGIQNDATEAMKVDTVAENTGEEEFFRISREQAEERVQRSVVRVQAMFRSYRAQQQYRRMKMVHEEAKLEFSGFGQ